MVQFESPAGYKSTTPCCAHIPLICSKHVNTQYPDGALSTPVEPCPDLGISLDHISMEQAECQVHSLDQIRSTIRL